VVGLSLLAEHSREAGASVQGDLLEVLRLALYWAWGWAVWKCSRNVARPVWTVAARAAVVGGLVLLLLL